MQQKYDIQDGYNRNHVLIGYCQLFLFLMKTLMSMFGIALCVNLYKQAMAFEKGHHIIDPEEQAFHQ